MKAMSGCRYLSAAIRKREVIVSGKYTIWQMWLCYCERNSYTFITHCKNRHARFSVIKLLHLFWTSKPTSTLLCTSVPVIKNSFSWLELTVQLQRMDAMHCNFVCNIPVCFVSNCFGETKQSIQECTYSKLKEIQMFCKKYSQNTQK
jgi:hypothetical protein